MEIALNFSTEILLLLFLVITFFQSGIDKLLDWPGNLNWLKDHFKDSPLRAVVPYLLGIILIAEITTAVLCAVGIYQFLASGQSTMAPYGALLSCITLLMLLFGQRLAKDYEGAMTIVIYFIPAIFLTYLLQA